MAAPPTRLGAAQAALMARPVSIIVGTRDGSLRPHVMRAVAARLHADGQRVTVLLPRAGSDAVLADLQANGEIAVVFSEPSSHLTLQLKGHGATLADATPDDFALATRHLEGFVGELGRIGFTPDVAHTLLRHDGALVAVHFGIAEAFDQTPGPAAGSALAGPAEA